MTWHNPLPLKLHPTHDSMSFIEFASGETGIPLAPHPGAFGVARRHHVHEGVDLYAPDGTFVYAVESGIVVAISGFTGPAKTQHVWWLDTDCVMIEGESGVVLYGEIKPRLDLVVGSKVEAGELVGAVTRVLRNDKGRPTSMLHLELLASGTKEHEQWELGEQKAPHRFDPTPYLLECAEEKTS